MNYLVFAVACSVCVSVFLKLARLNQVNVAQAIATNYIVATALTWLALKPNLSMLHPEFNAIALFVALGVLLPSVFIMMGNAVTHAGIVKADAAQRLSVFIPVIWALWFFGEKLSDARALGIAFAFAALLCLLYKASAKKGRGNYSQVAISLLSVWLGYGVIDILFKQVAKTGGAFSSNLLVAFVLAGVLMFVYLLFKRTQWSGKSLLAGLLLGVLNFGNILFYVRAHQAFTSDPTLVFVGMNIGVITLGTLVGVAVFREKLSKVNILGVLLAIVSIFCLYYLERWLPQ